VDEPWNGTRHEESYIESCRRRVEEQYAHTTLSSGSVGGCFGSILCSELHHGGPHGEGLHFSALAAKWNIPVSMLGEIIADHCRRLEPQLTVRHELLPSESGAVVALGIPACA
jgi:hypothetical protein